MSSKYDMSGSLWKVEQPKSDKHASYSGKATIEGVEYYMDAWVNEHNGKKYFSIKFKPIVAKQSKPSKPARITDDPDEDSIPF